jgi:hypothetical protein
MAFLPYCLYLFIYSRKRKSYFLKILWLSLIAVFYYLIIVSGFGTALILSTFILIASFLISENKRKKYFIIWNFNFYWSFIYKQRIYPQFIRLGKRLLCRLCHYDKIVDIQYSIQTNDFEGQLNTRGNLYADSWNTFSKYPIFGSAQQSDAGGHLFVADFLAWFGLVGTLPLILFFYYSFRRII